MKRLAESNAVTKDSFIRMTSNKDGRSPALRRSEPKCKTMGVISRVVWLGASGSDKSPPACEAKVAVVSAWSSSSCTITQHPFMFCPDCSVDAKQRGLQKVPQSWAEPPPPPVCKCFRRRGFVHTCGHRFIFCSSSVICLHLHAASILQSLAVNRLQCAALSGPRYLYLWLWFSSGFEPYQVSARVPALHKQELDLNATDLKLSKRLRREKKP